MAYWHGHKWDWETRGTKHAPDQSFVLQFIKTLTDDDPASVGYHEKEQIALSTLMVIPWSSSMPLDSKTHAKA
jgi:hypothetical protein